MWSGKTRIDIYGRPLPYPVVFEVTERYMLKNQRLLLPDIEIDSYWCSIEEMEPAEVVELYHDHGTSEQFHSEIKSDMGVERLPIGNFASNSLVLHLTMLSYNMLRIIGQQWVAIDTDEGTLPLSSRQKMLHVGGSGRSCRTLSTWLDGLSKHVENFLYHLGRLTHLPGLASL